MRKNNMDQSSNHQSIQLVFSVLLNSLVKPVSAERDDKCVYTFIFVEVKKQWVKWWICVGLHSVRYMPGGLPSMTWKCAPSLPFIFFSNLFCKYLWLVNCPKWIVTLMHREQNRNNAMYFDYRRKHFHLLLFSVYVCRVCMHAYVCMYVHSYMFRCTCMGMHVGVKVQGWNGVFSSIVLSFVLRYGLWLNSVFIYSDSLEWQMLWEHLFPVPVFHAEISGRPPGQPGFTWAPVFQTHIFTLLGGGMYFNCWTNSQILTFFKYSLESGILAILEINFIS